MNLIFFGKKEHPEANKTGYDTLKASCSNCGKTVIELIIGVDNSDRKNVLKAEEKLEDLILRHIHKHCPFCGNKLKEPKVEESFREVAVSKKEAPKAETTEPKAETTEPKAEEPQATEKEEKKTETE